MKRVKDFPGRALAVLAILAALAWAACEGTDKDFDAVHLSGFVREAASRLPIDSAWVALYDTIPALKTYTDTAGTFDLITLHFAAGTLFAGKAGFRTAFKTFKNVDNNIDSIMFELERSSD